jgi:hypothetical protein
LFSKVFLNGKNKRVLITENMPNRVFDCGTEPYRLSLSPFTLKKQNLSLHQKRKKSSPSFELRKDPRITQLTAIHAFGCHGNNKRKW